MQTKKDGALMVKIIYNFLELIQSKIKFNNSLIVTRQKKYFLVNYKLKENLTRNFYYAGIFLGRKINGTLFPSFNLLKIIANEFLNKVVVNKKAEWFFICGKDVFKKDVIGMIGPNEIGQYTLILNQIGDCLGFGKISSDKSRRKNGVFVKNLLDIGDFLRREK